jgi:nicotinamide phosphoribosyltransferase
VVPSVAEEKKKKGGLWVFRPDSGDPVEVILMALEAGEKTFGCTINKKGYKVNNGVGNNQKEEELFFFFLFLCCGVLILC